MLKNFRHKQSWVKKFCRARGIPSLEAFTTQEVACVIAMYEWSYSPEYAAKRLDTLLDYMQPRVGGVKQEPREAEK